MSRSIFVLAAFLLVSAFPFSASAAELKLSGWIPYWEAKDGANDARKHLDVLTEIHPFGFSVQKDGSLKDLMNLKQSYWKRLISSAESKDVLVVPTVMWSDTASIHRILSDADLRADHVEYIVAMVKKGDFDGVDIDYEGKLAETRPYFSSFLKELDAALGTKMLSCTIEARTPPDSLYTNVPKTLEYANDYAEINRYCDKVNIMAYDQQRADLKLNSTRAGEPYYPVADKDWVRKVVAFAVKSIEPSKIMLSVATYGREVEVTVAPNWYKAYTQKWSVSHGYAEDTADKYDVTPMRNKGGELSFSYIPKGSSTKIPSSVKAPTGTESGNVAAARALAYANQSGNTVAVNVVWWSDADAIENKVALAREYGLRGISIFKIDGNEDRNIWDLF